MHGSELTSHNTQANENSRATLASIPNRAIGAAANVARTVGGGGGGGGERSSGAIDGRALGTVLPRWWGRRMPCGCASSRVRRAWIWVAWSCWHWLVVAAVGGWCGAAGMAGIGGGRRWRRDPNCAWPGGIVLGGRPVERDGCRSWQVLATDDWGRPQNPGPRVLRMERAGLCFQDRRSFRACAWSRVRRRVA